MTGDDHYQENTIKEESGSIRKIGSILEGEDMDQLKIFNINIRNIYRNLEELKILMSSEKMQFDIISFTETWTDNITANNSNIGIIGYECIWSDNKYNKNGGVGVAIKKSIKYKKIKLDTIKIEADTIVVEIEGKGTDNNYMIVIVYRNPSRDEYLFIEDIDNLISSAIFKNKKLIILGDFNIDLNKRNKISLQLEDTMINGGYIQTIKENTRVTDTTSTKIDLCFTNIVDRYLISGIIHTGITDHYAIYIAIENIKPISVRKLKEKDKLRRYTIMRK